MLLADQIRTLGQGDHVCLIYNTLAEQAAAIGPFLRSGLESGERCVYICDERTATEIGEALRGQGVDVAGYQNRGALQLVTEREAYLASGDFSPQSMIDLLRRLEGQALEDGFRGLRVAGEMTWALGPATSCGRALEYEALLNRYFPGSHALAVCQYNRERFTPDVIEQVLQTHPIAVVGERVISNPFYEAPEVFLGRDAAEARVQWKLDQLRHAHAAEERVRHSEERYRLLVEGVPDCAMFWLDPEGRVTSWNAGAERLTGYAEGEVLGRQLATIATDGDAGRGAVEAALQAAVTEGQHTGEGWRVRKDGTRFFASDVVTASTDPGGRLLGFSVVSRDVTGRRRSAALIAAQKQSLELVVAGAPLAEVLQRLVRTAEEQSGGAVVASILLLDEGCRLRNGASPNLPEHYLQAIDGLPADPGLGTCCAAAATGAVVVTPDFETAPGWNGLSHLPIAAGFRGAWSMPILARDGCVLGTFGTYFRECREPTAVEREVVAVLASTASIAIERGRAETALREREAFNRRLLESSGDAIMVLDLDGRVLSINRPGEHMMGITDPASLVGTAWTALWPAEHRDVVDRALDDARGGAEGRFQLPCRIRAGDDGWLDVVVTAVPDANGEPSRILSIARDVTQQKQAEAELRRARDDAEEASRAKSQFLAVMSHELRTPLTGIIGYADLLASDIWGATTEQQRAQISRIKVGAWHLVSVIDEILTFSRVEAGREEVVRRPVGFVRCVRESAELLHPQAAAKGIQLRILEPGGDFEIETDAGKLRQIVLNLTGNAVKFTDRGSVELSIERADRAAVLRIRDSGPGIPPDKVEWIFEPFVQVDQSNTRTKGGTGLGLTVCRSLSRLLGGDITVVESTPGAGSTFELRLPLEAAAEIRTRPASDATLRG